MSFVWGQLFCILIGVFVLGIGVGIIAGLLATVVWLVGAIAMGMSFQDRFGIAFLILLGSCLCWFVGWAMLEGVRKSDI